MASGSRYRLPAFLLWMSVLVSASLAGSMVPVARKLPLVIYLMGFTAVYHSGLLVSSLVPDSKSDTRRASLHLDPLEGSHMMWTIFFGVFWLTECVIQTNELIKGAGEDRDYFLAIFCCIEWILNARIVYLSLMAWRHPDYRSRQESDPDLESCRTHVVLECDDHTTPLIHFFSVPQSALPPRGRDEILYENGLCSMDHMPNTSYGRSPDVPEPETPKTYNLGGSDYGGHSVTAGSRLNPPEWTQEKI